MVAFLTMDLVKTSRFCTHCGNCVKNDLHREETCDFCCSGCKAVYHFLNSHDLKQYYTLRGQANGPSQKHKKGKVYAYLDDPSVKEAFSKNETTFEVQFYLEGMHCMACLWLVEKMPTLVAGVASARVHMGQSLVTLRCYATVSLALVAETFCSMGYTPHLMTQDYRENERLQKKENRQFLVRMGVSAGAAAHIMLMSISIYAGAKPPFDTLFHAVSLVWMIPVMLYSAVPFYKNAWGALRTRQMSIDLPIAMAILAGFGLSVGSLFSVHPVVYFDTLAMLVFLLLSSRFLLRKISQKSDHLRFLRARFFPTYATRRCLDLTTTEDISLDTVQIGDCLVVPAHSQIPADGVLLEAVGLINTASLTGESYPEMTYPGDPVFCGTTTMDDSIVMQVTAGYKDSRLAHLLDDLAAVGRSGTEQVLDLVANRLLKGVIGLAIGVVCFFWAMNQGGEGVRRALSLLIVTCPCALGISVPLTYSLMIRKAVLMGFWIKKGETLQDLAMIKSVWFDKTGTLTVGSFELRQWKSVIEDPMLKSIVYALEKPSNHPIAKAICRAFQDEGVIAADVKNVQEVIGTGVSGDFGPNRYEVRQAQTEFYDPGLADSEGFRSSVGVYKDSVLVAALSLGDLVKPGVKKMVKDLQKMGLKVGLISGDREETVTALAKAVGMTDFFWALSPEKKREMVQCERSLMMVGDGANDSPALAQSSVGVAVQGSLEMTLKVADVAMTEPHMSRIVDLVRMGRITQKIIYATVGLSLVYNVFFATAAVFGWVSPLVAAIVMPVSSMTVLGIAYGGSLQVKRKTT